jgi:cytochrome c oxidase subunit III
MSAITETGHIAEEHRDDYGSKLGMWIFLFTEMFFFGGLFLVYAVYRVMYADDFHAAALHLNVTIGAVNTVLLLISSLTMSVAVTAVQKGDAALALKMVGLSILLAFIFLTNKFFEWDHKILVQLYPGSELMLSLKHGYVLFFGLYFFMTGLHALHLIIGIILMFICMAKINNHSFNPERNIQMVNITLYWHLVDLIWFFLFPLLYLIP